MDPDGNRLQNSCSPRHCMGALDHASSAPSVCHGTTTTIYTLYIIDRAAILWAYIIVQMPIAIAMGNTADQLELNSIAAHCIHTRIVPFPPKKGHTNVTNRVDLA